MEVFIELSLIIAIAVAVSGVMKLLKQPLIIGYIFTGILLSPYFLNIVKSTDTIHIFSQIGVTFLLFIVGISLSPKVIKDVGKISLITGIGQILFTSIIGFLISKLLGFTTIVSIYIAIALTFSSTIIIMKLLSDKKDTEKLYGKISIGFLLIQDIFAMILLMIVSSFSGGLQSISFSITTILYGILFIIIFILISIYILPKLSRFFAKSQEFLFIFSIGWGMGLAALFHYFGLSMEIGALIAGIALSISPFHYEISSKLRPIRDFFIILFFILLGSQMTFGNLNELIIPALIFSAFILIGNPLIVIILMGAMGYKKKIGFQAGFTVAQISEFSLILISLGLAVGHLTGEILSLVTFIGLITISGSTYLITYSDKIYPHFQNFLKIFERKNTIQKKDNESSNKIILFGYDKIGPEIYESIKKTRKKTLVVDYNPETISQLTKQNIPCRYGDADDEEFLNELNISNVEMIISTIPEFETNALLIEKTKNENKKAIIIVTSHNLNETKELYKIGATYVIMPHYLGGKHTAKMLSNFKLKKQRFETEKEKHLEEIKAIIRKNKKFFKS